MLYSDKNAEGVSNKGSFSSRNFSYSDNEILFSPDRVDSCFDDDNHSDDVYDIQCVTGIPEISCGSTYEGKNFCVNLLIHIYFLPLCSDYII